MSSIIAINILNIMSERNISRDELTYWVVNNTNLTDNYISNILNGSMIPSQECLDAVARFLGVSILDLVNINHSKPKHIHNSFREAFSDEFDRRGYNKNILDISDNISDMILYHKRVRDNGLASLASL